VRICLKWCLWLTLVPSGRAAETLPYYYGHPAEVDSNGVIAPWYKGQNGQYDYRVRIAAETLKRYPWTLKGKAVMSAPEYVFNGHWSIDQEGKISAATYREWDDGDLAQRASYIIGGLIDYYMYTGDPAVFTPISLTADYLIDYCQTDPTHGWPRMLISVPTMGTTYGRCLLGASDNLRDSQGKIQLDNMAQLATEFVRAYQLTGNTRWYEAARHWADLLAENRNRQPGAAPWGRYANNAGGNGMNDIQTGGVAMVLGFLDEMIRSGYSGHDNNLVQARDAGRAYLRDALLPSWYDKYDTWGRNFWDWECPVQDVYGTEYPALYMMEHKDIFPNWKNDARNILSLFIAHANVSTRSNGDVFHGAWAYPESSDCCGRSLWYSPMELAAVFARYAVEADDEWAREIARRSQMLATYDPRADGSSMDLIDGGVMVNRTWFKIAHPMPLKNVLRTIAWLPEITGANRENHIVRSSGVVKRVVYGKDRITYSTADAVSPATDVLRLSYLPKSITADGQPLESRKHLSANGYAAHSLPGGDTIVTIRHDGATNIVITGEDPQSMVDDRQFSFEGKWSEVSSKQAYGGSMHTSAQAGASATWHFRGNQVRLVGAVGSRGGLAEVYLDDWKQLVAVDCNSPIEVNQQVLYYRNGLSEGAHTLRLVARGAGNPISQGTEIYIDGAQSSEAAGDSGFGEGGGPSGAQRMIFGYGGRVDYVDSSGNAWRPATELIARTGHLSDAVAQTWWTIAQATFIGAPHSPTKDRTLYQYGVHYTDFRVPLTVGPGTYHVRLKFAENQFSSPGQRAMTIWINDHRVTQGFDIFATAGGMQTPVDLVFNNIKAKNGLIEIRFAGETILGRQQEATVQALEIGPGDGGAGATAKTIYRPE
jgi:Malectin domain